MAEPEFGLEITLAKGNEQGYHLWVGEKGQRNTIMNDEDNHNSYKLGWEAEKGLSAMCKDSWRWQSQNPEGYK